MGGLMSRSLKTRRHRRPEVRETCLIAGPENCRAEMAMLEGLAANKTGFEGR